MTDSLDIAEVARLTGLTSRALRFYEARGLLTPLRTASGRRHYGPAELERVNQIMTLKRAGLSLAQIERLTAGRRIDLKLLVAAQIEALDAQAREIAEARTLLRSVQSRIDRSEPIDVATFCSLIRQGETIVTNQNWDQVTSRYLTEEQLNAFKATVDTLPQGFNQADYAAKWKDLGSRIQAALPMDPAGEQAQAFLDEWQALIQPFIDVASPEMIAGVHDFYEHIEEWEHEANPGFGAEVWRFHQAAARARESMNR